jgi:signal peptidase I
MPVSLASRWFRDFTSIVLTCLTVLSVTCVAAVWILPRTGLGRSLNVLTESMAPAIPAGSLIVIRSIDPHRIAIGDAVTFHPRSNDNALVTHRVVDSVSGPNRTLSFRTRGDANSGDDPNLVPAAAIVGKVMYQVPYLGRLAGRVTVTALVALALIPPLVAWDRARRRRSKGSS